MTGFGIRIWVNEDTYEGQWLADKAAYVAVGVWGTYEGQWVEDKAGCTGDGTGAVYQGWWLHDKAGVRARGSISDTYPCRYIR